jgi:tetratricopeptide (TPR) repeat protein
MLHSLQTHGPVSSTSISAALERVLASAAFQRSPQLSRFLRYAVENTLSGNTDVLREIVVGIEVFGRGEDFDPRIDPIVRIDARRLRARLAGYYENEGSADPIVIELEPGSYVPRFREAARARTATRKPILLPKEAGARTVMGLLRKGRRLLDLLSVEASMKSSALFRNAVAANPNHAMAYLGLAAASTTMTVLLCESGNGEMGRARDAVMRAIQLDPSIPEAYALLAVLMTVCDFDFRGAHETFLRALRINPRASTPRRARAMWHLAPAGMLDEAAQELATLDEREAPCARVLYQSGWIHYLHRDYRAAIRNMERARNLSPGCTIAGFVLGMAHRHNGNSERAREILKAEDLRVPYPLLPLHMDAVLRLQQGQTGDALAIAEKMERMYSPGVIDPVMIAETFAVLGDRARAFQWLETAYRDRAPRLIYLKADPGLDLLREDSAFGALVTKLGL